MPSLGYSVLVIETMAGNMSSQHTLINVFLSNFSNVYSPNLKKKQIKTKIGVIIWVPVHFALVFILKRSFFGLFVYSLHAFFRHVILFYHFLL
jgi:hypothetical protein